MNPAPVANHDTTPVHVHKRGDWRPCPATMPAPLEPRKLTAVWLYRWAEAIQHQETFEAFGADLHPFDLDVAA